MSTIEDFKNAPVGATATHKAAGIRAMKIDDSDRGWIIRTGLYVDGELIARWGYTLEPPAPTTAREALDLAWELAHEVKPGQVIPAGTRYVRRSQSGGLSTFTATEGWTPAPRWTEHVRTLDPLPEPEPDWLDALIILATCECRGMELWQPHNKKDGTWECAHCGFDCHWSELHDVTPLYPKGQDT